MAYSLDTDSFLNAFFCMTSRRGWQQEAMSYNDTNFILVNTELKELINRLDKSKIEKSATNKRAIYHILSKAGITDEESSTTFTGEEDLINSRPLTYQTADIKDDILLTPNHFLHNLADGEFTPDSVDAEFYNLKKRWSCAQELVKHFWGWWMKE